MAEAIQLPENAQCLKCGYLLHGLREPICPECGRPFDPLDPKTFDANPERRQRRRWIKRMATALGIILLIFLVAPRKILKSDMVFNTTAQSKLKKLVDRVR